VVDDEAGATVAGTGREGHVDQSSIAPFRTPPLYRCPLVDDLDVRWLMTRDAPDVNDVLAELINRPAWHRQAACRGMGTDAFFPERGGSGADAKAICVGCTVREDCLSAASADPGTLGIWGGVSERGRQVLRRGAA